LVVVVVVQDKVDQRKNRIAMICSDQENEMAKEDSTDSKKDEKKLKLLDGSDSNFGENTVQDDLEVSDKFDIIPKSEID